MGSRIPGGWWRHQIRLLAAAGHRVIAPDLRGFGRSSRPSDVADYRTNVLVGDLTGLLDSTGVDRPLPPALPPGSPRSCARWWPTTRSGAPRVEELGIGVHERFAGLDQDRLEAGLRRALHPEVITRSQAIGDTVRADTGAAGRAVDLIESKLPD